MPVSAARHTAFEILCLVEGGGYASDLLRSRSAGLSRKDAALATELVLGVLRLRGRLEWLIEHFSGRPAARLDPEVRLALALGIHQIRHLSRIPAHAAVTESVELVKRARKRSAAGFVNAVLRKVDRSPVEWPDRATALSTPAWLLESWDRQYGSEAAAGIARAFLEPPETYVRVPESRREEAVRSGLEPSAVPGCFRVPAGAAVPAGLRQQDIGSQAILQMLDLEAGQRFLDVCAAPGNKTAQALESGVRAVACDVSLRRLAGLRDLGEPLAVVDGRRPLPFRRPFDRVLVDAPCSGTGTLGRNPEIKWRLRPEDLAALGERQSRILGNALECLAPGGRALYATCSLEAGENEAVVREVLAAKGPPFRLERMERRLPGADPGDGFFGAVIVREA